MSAPPPPSSPPPTGTPPTRPRRLTRRSEGRMLGGVAAGLAGYLGVDVVVVRIGFVVLAFVPFPGFGLLVYLAMLLLVPEAGDDEAVIPTKLGQRSAGFYVGVGLIGIATFALLATTGQGRFGGGLLPLLLIGLGVALWVDADRRAPNDRGRGAPGQGDGATSWEPPPAPPTATWAPSASAAPATWTAPTAGAAPTASPSPTPAPPDEPPHGADTDRPEDAPMTTPPGSTDTTERVTPWPPAAPVGDAGGPPPPTTWPPQEPAWTPPPARSRPRSPLGRVTFGLALLAGGAVWLLDLVDVISVPVSSMLAAALVVLGLGLLVGAVVGRARWLAIPVALLLPLTFGVAALDDLGIDLRRGVDVREIVVLDASQLDDPISAGAGELVVDLTGFAEPEGTVLDASLGAGELRIELPDGAGLRGTARVEVGELNVFGGSSAGVGVDRDLDVVADAGAPTFDVDLRMGAGEIAIVHRPPTDDLVDDGSSSTTLDTPEVVR